MRLVADLIVGGLAAGALYGLMALGLVLIYKTTDVVNFGHADMAMLSTFIAYALHVQAGWALVPAVFGAVAFAALLGVLMERAVMKPARDRKATVLGLVVATLGMALILNGTAGIIWGHDVKSFPYVASGAPLQVGGVVIPRDQIFNLAVGVGLAAGLHSFFRFSNVGVAMRATISNRTAASLMGIPVSRMFVLSWAIGAALGAVAGMLAAPTLFLEPNRMVDLLIKGFAAAVLGGFTSMPGAVVGGLGLGLLENFVGAYVSLDLKDTFAFLLIVVVLAVRPEGLLGRPVRKRV